ncbi:aspartate phosphatase, partial [Bacillus subtilis]|nr:aspartate phosphatase [Bacillus subtilis]
MYILLRLSIVSLNYINNDLNIYKGYENYKRKFATALMVVGTNYTDLGQFDNDDEAYFQAISISKELGDNFFEAQ